MAEAVDGLVVVDKPPGWTSHDAVARCRKVFGQRRVGHAGTLDPDATGVLLVGLGRVTRLLRFLTPLPKTYQGEVVLGTATSTLDASGEVTGTWDMSSVTADDVARAAIAFVGDIRQVPPMVSALQIGGRRLHELAREGVEVEREARAVSVYRFDTAPSETEGVYRIEVECSSGTYIRSLAADLGEALGGGAHLRNLRRTRIGSFGIEAAVGLDELDRTAVLSPAEALRDQPSVVVGDRFAADISHGRRLSREAVGAVGEGPWRVIDGGGRMLAVYEAGEGAELRAAVVLAPA